MTRRKDKEKMDHDTFSVFGWVASRFLALFLPAHTLNRIATRMSPQMNVATDSDGPARAVYLITEHKWNPGLAMADPSWLRRVGGVFLITCLPLFIASRILLLLWHLVKVVVVSATLVLFTALDMISYTASAITRAIFFYPDLSDAMRNADAWSKAKLAEHPSYQKSHDEFVAVFREASDESARLRREGIPS